MYKVYSLRMYLWNCSTKSQPYVIYQKTHFVQKNQHHIKPDLKILIAPLDWGLGHATRCIPIIRYLLEQGCRVTLAGEGAAAVLLQSNFPELDILPLPGYRIRYSQGATGFTIKILGQIPKILRAIQSENKWLKTIQLQHDFDLIISDNRYGLKIPDTFCVIMTHQLQIQTGMGKFADQLLQRAHYRILEKFDACWVVDREGEDSLGGALSQPHQIPDNASYIGILSQLNPDIQKVQSGRQEILVLLSGPEPMRSILEVLILSQIEALTQYQFHIVAGNPLGIAPAHIPDHASYYTHLNAEKLNVLIANATLVICRSGYSTLMDLAVMQKRALVVPTPGQTEQEYLGAQLAQKGIVYCQEQSLLNLSQDIPMALSRPGFRDTSGSNHFQNQVDKVLITTRTTYPKADN